jgi:hypothetical protein
MSEERKTFFPPESRRRLDDVIRLIVQQLLKRNGRARPVSQKYASALSTSVPKFDLGRFVGPKLVRVRGQNF